MGGQLKHGVDLYTGKYGNSVLVKGGWEFLCFGFSF